MLNFLLGGSDPPPLGVSTSLDWRPPLEARGRRPHFLQGSRCIVHGSLYRPHSLFGGIKVHRPRFTSSALVHFRRKAPALPAGAHRHVPRALWLFARKRECRHLMSLRIGMQIAESHYLAKPYRMMCLSITQLLFDFFRNSSPTTFRAADKRRLRSWPAAA